MKGKNASAFFCVGKCWVVPKECGAQPLSLTLALSPSGEGVQERRGDEDVTGNGHLLA
jgi:hypothetical protein